MRRRALFLILATTACGRGGHVAGDDAGAVDATPAPFSIQALDGVGIGSIGSTGWATTGSAAADVDWRQGPFASARLVLDLTTTCFPFEGWASDPPPAGHNWPARCDAFDRNVDVVLDDDPGFEVIHAVTPFGGPAHIDVDVTDLANARPGAHRVRVDLASYSDPQGLVTGANGGWTVSVRLDMTPGPPPRRVLAAVPVFRAEVRVADGAPVASWTVPDGATAARLEYRASGHGQAPGDERCIGPAEEFCDRRHLVFIDGVMIDNVEPWREDCVALCTLGHYGPAGAGFDYCQENPCGAPDSVRASRANWCPGSMTPPFAWEGLPALLAPGPHTFTFQVTRIADGGTWLASATYYAYAD